MHGQTPGGSGASWMANLAAHYERERASRPDEKLLILFDIDGTILDMRHAVFHALKAFDARHGTHFFRRLHVSDITVHEEKIGELLNALRVPQSERERITSWYAANMWSSELILRSHRPFSGVLEVIRWFQLQPNTFVGLNTGRSEGLRKDTLRSLNELGREYRVHFSDELLHMRDTARHRDVPTAKAAGVGHFRDSGYHVIAFADNEPQNLKAVSEVDPERAILLLHADTIFQTARTHLPAPWAKGNSYDLTDLIDERSLPRHIQFVWHGINDQLNLRQFLASEITWAECDVRLDPTETQLILRHDSFKKSPLGVGEEWLELPSLLRCLEVEGRSVKVDLKAGGALVDKVLETLARYEFDDSRLWFNGNVERLQAEGFKRLAEAHPGAIMQCPVDFLAPLMLATPARARDIVEMLAGWGINRFSISWLTGHLKPMLDLLDEWGYDVNIYNVPDLEAFLQSVLLLPRSVTSDFNFPKWNYFGRGSGKEGRFHEHPAPGDGRGCTQTP